jgi:hypothetical protein
MDSTSAICTARGFNFFSPRSLRLMGALGRTTPPAQNSTFAIPMKNRAAKELFFRPRTLPINSIFVELKISWIKEKKNLN